MATIVVTVHVGRYATVRAIEASGLRDVTYTGIIAETKNKYTYEITGTPRNGETTKCQQT